MAIKKSELYSSLWRSCDELRGGMDASQYKDYVLVLLFVKYVSDKKESLLDVPPGGRFADMVALKGRKEIGDGINKIVTKLAEANDLQGVIDVADFNDPDKLGAGKEMVDRLTNLVAIFDNPALDFRSNRADGDDLLGDAYEYLMRHFATESGKSKGQFYTPAEVSRVMAKVIGVGSARSTSQTIYDPTCGSGSLLLKAHDEAKSQTGLDLALYGQEMDNATAALARMNMILHDSPTAEIWKGNVLANPHFKQPDGSLKTFDFIVANPPFSSKAWSNGLNPAKDEFKRFEFGAPPAKNGDMAFLLHILTSLKSTGKAAVNLPHGVLFRGNAEATIRREIIRRGYIKGIIGLPANLFYGTGIPACIVVLDKEHAAGRMGIFMVDASKGFVKDGNKNRLRAQDIHKIVDIFTRQVELPRYSRMVPLAEIEANDFNLNLPRYIDTSEPEDLQDIDAHLRGGIPLRDLDALDTYWQVFPGVRDALFADADRPGYCQLRVPVDAIKAAIFGHPEFITFNQSVTALFEKWQQAHRPRLHAIAIGHRPKALIETLAEDLLAIFRAARLLDSYDVYQHLMDYWAETMQDDVYTFVADGWEAARVYERTSKKGAIPEIKSEIIPSDLVISRYFAFDREKIERLEAEQEVLTQRMEEMLDETGGQESPLEALRGSKGITKGAIQERAIAIKKEILSGSSTTAAEIAAAKSIKKDFGRVDWVKGYQDEADLFPELDILHEYLLFYEADYELMEQIRAKKHKLFEKVMAKYDSLTEAEIKILVVDDKWLVDLAAAVQSEMDRVSRALTGRVRQLAERYAIPLPQLTCEASALAARVEEHLKKMGAAWT